ncbi:hypothetical protein GOP47_0015589 [Adiantum capillus-veneris]|uniref:BTB domain-containing protein n=1 Tax=Adiantum capillus-veneris TaxID=13818 RepID=A0A9D4UL36_ADICA|nr:hypothetical protein GOP47_0015589 [Adiantum capillus-veneris]
MALRCRKAPDVVKTHGAWCCIGRPFPSSPIVPSSKASSSQVIKHHKQAQKPEKRGKLSEKSKKYVALESGVGEALKSGEIAALIKQGFINANNTDKVGNSSPFRSFLVTPTGRISPVVDASVSPQSSANGSLQHSEAFYSQAASASHAKKPSSTLYDMISGEQEFEKRALNAVHKHGKSKERLLMQPKVLADFWNGAQFNDPSSCDVKLTLRNKEGFCITIKAHSQILAARSRYFATMLDEMLAKEKPQLPHLIEIANCEDVEIYLETLQLMYSYDMKRTLIKGNVRRVLGILKICASIAFEAGILCCLEYLEAMPWAEEEEHKVTSLLSDLHLGSIGAGEVLQRVSTDDAATRSDDVLTSLVQLITKSTDEKARREMKGLVSRMLRENTMQGHNVDDLSKESLYESSHSCVNSIVDLFTRASAAADVHASRIGEERHILAAQIARQADNLSWLVDIMIDRQVADDFVRLWAFHAELSSLHRRVPVIVRRYEVSRIMARLCVALGKGQVLVPKEARYALLHNWLQPLIDDFGWMQRACKGLDMDMVEEGLCQTILTLPLQQQQIIMMAWFERFLKSGDDCPKLQRAFEIWWRRTFARPSMELAIS